MNNVDKQYLDLMRDILANGVSKTTRSGEVRSVFGRFMQFDLREGLPLLTTKKVYTKGVIHELLWFLKGSTNIKYLVDNNVNIWNDDAYRWLTTQWFKEIKEKIVALKLYHKGEHVVTLTPDEWVDKEGCASLTEFMNTMTKEKFLKMVKDEYSFFIPKDLSYFDYTTKEYVFGDLGPVYGKQWRGFGQKNIDQIQNIINTLKTNPDDRRMLCTALNPDVLDEVALPPCHVISQFYTRLLSLHERREWYMTNTLSMWKEWTSEELDNFNVPTRALSLSFYCRSQDVPLGTPFNLLSYSLLCHIIANICNMVPERLVYFGGDVHIYKNQIEGCEEQLSRNGFDKLPQLIIKRRLKDLDDIEYDDFEIINYQSEPPIKFPLSVG